MTPPENFFRDEHFHLNVFLSEEVFVKRPEIIANNLLVISHCFDEVVKHLREKSQVNGLGDF